jgi:hypothetical protein
MNDSACGAVHSLLEPSDRVTGHFHILISTLQKDRSHAKRSSLVRVNAVDNRLLHVHHNNMAHVKFDMID